MSELNVYEAGETVVISAADAAGDEFLNDGFAIPHWFNTDPVAKTVTITGQRECNHPDPEVHDRTIVIAPSTMVDGARLNPTFFNDFDGKVQMTYDDVANLSVYVTRTPEAD